MTFDFPGYDLRFIQCDRSHDDSAHLKSYIFKFFSPITRYHYVVKAINMNIAIMRVFIEIRKVVLKETDIREQLKQIKERLGEHDTLRVTET